MQCCTDRLSLSEVTHVYYHADCVDGLFAAYAVRKFRPDCVYIPVNYGHPAPDVSGQKVLIVDFSWGYEETVKMIEAAEGKLLILDHHDSAKRKLSDLSDQFCIIDETRCGAIITRDWVQLQVESAGGQIPEEWAKAPEEMSTIPCRDIWRFVHEYDTRTAEKDDNRWMMFNLAFVRGRRISKIPFSDIDALWSGDAEFWYSFWMDGKIRYEIMEEIVDANLSRLFYRDYYDPNVVEGEFNQDGTPKRKVWTVATSNLSASQYLNETADKMRIKKPFVTFLAAFTIESKKGESQFSLRAGNDDCPNLAKLSEHIRDSNPGVITAGGHPRAAGIRFSSPVFELPLERGPEYKKPV